MTAGAVVGAFAFAPAAADADLAACPLQHERITDVNRGQLELSLLCLTNEHRAGSGIPPVALDTRLGQAARAHAEDMVARDFFDHFNPEGLGPSARAAAAGFPGQAAENIAYTSQGTVRGLFDAWRGSPGHNANLLDSDYRSIGLGLALGRPNGSNGITGDQLFAVQRANTSQTGIGALAGSPDDSSASSRCLEAKRVLKKRKRASQATPWVKRLRVQVRKAKRRVEAECA